MRAVENTPFDFKTEKVIGTDRKSLDDQIALVKGYDHNFVLNGTGMRKVAQLRSIQTGIAMEVHTDLPGMQVCGGNYMTESFGKNGQQFVPYGAICLETQVHPDAIHQPRFPQCILKQGEAYFTKTVYTFRSE